MNLKSILTTGALVAALVVPALSEAQTVVRKYPHKTVIVRRPARYVHRRAIVVRHLGYRHRPHVIVHPHRTVIIRH